MHHDVCSHYFSLPCYEACLPSPRLTAWRAWGVFVRPQIGVMYGNPETTSGGNALKYYASVSHWMERSECGVWNEPWVSFDGVPPVLMEVYSVCL